MLEGTVFPVHMTGVMTVGHGGSAEGSYAGLFGLVPLGYPTPLPMIATFTVHSDCTGEIEAPNGFGGINTDKLVILDNGREIRTVTCPGRHLRGSSRWCGSPARVNRRRCAAATPSAAGT